MDSDYFSDRDRGQLPRITEEVGAAAWGGIVALILSRIADGALGLGFPEACGDGRGTTGTNDRMMGFAVKAEIHDISWPLDADTTPPTLAVLDLTEFVFRHVGKPRVRDHHQFYGHDHLVYDRDEGRAELRRDVNRVFARNGLAYQMQNDGRIIRLAPPIASEELVRFAVATGDPELDAMLEASRRKYLDPDPSIRREALEKLWDAWERLKTIHPAADKKASASMLLDRASEEPNFRKMLEDEARVLTDIGNTFQIRHTETTQTPVKDAAHVDYLFHRMFALIWLILKKHC